jgi:hypothetical protein
VGAAIGDLKDDISAFESEEGGVHLTSGGVRPGANFSHGGTREEKRDNETAEQFRGFFHDDMDSKT